MSPRVAFDLLIISDAQPALEARIERALAEATPGRVALLLREPQRKSGDLLSLAMSLRALTSARGVLLLISDRIDVALAARADGVQLPETGFAPRVARALLGPDACIGVSRHDRSGLLAATADAADYATLSPVHAVEGKGTPLGHDGFASALRDVSLPVYALGGVRCEDVPSLAQSGARGVAVIREVLAADEPGARVRALLAALSPTRSRG